MKAVLPIRADSLLNRTDIRCRGCYVRFWSAALSIGVIHWTLLWRFGKDSLEVNRCRQRSTLGDANAHEEPSRGCGGSTELAAVVSKRSWRKISLWKAGDIAMGKVWKRRN